MDYIVVYRKLNLFLLCIGLAPFRLDEKSGHVECRPRFAITTFACLIAYTIMLIAGTASDVLHLRTDAQPIIVNLHDLPIPWTRFIVLLSISHRYDVLLSYHMRA